MPPHGTTPDNRFYWRGLDEHRLLVQSCVTCASRQSPPMPRCANCGSWEFEILEVEPIGTLYSWIRVHRRQLLSNYDGDSLPVAIATVEFEGGWRTFGRLIGGQRADPVIGTSLRGVYIDRDGWTELGFEEVGE